MDRYNVPCLQCDIPSFATKGSYDRHMRRRHGEVAKRLISIDDLKSFKCQVCERTFTTKGAQERHFNIFHLHEHRKQIRLLMAQQQQQQPPLPSVFEPPARPADLFLDYDED